MSSTVDSLIAQLTELASTADLSARFKIATQLARLTRSVATPRQMMQQYSYMYTEQAMVKIASDLGIFAILADSGFPLMKTQDIASKCGCDPTLAERILKHLAATSAISEVGASTFAANETTRVLATPVGNAGIQFGFDTLNKAFQELPSFLKKTGYKNPDNVLSTPFHQASGSDLPYFLWVQSRPEIIKHFFPHLDSFKSPVTWAEVVPLDEILKNADSTAPLFVDVGGGQGAQSAAFRKAIDGRFSGRVINQDLAETVAAAPSYEGVEMMAQDFTQEQQIKGAKIYYMRQCLHDMPDVKAKQVLQRIKDAMSPQSLLFIDELVIPEAGASRFAMQLDVTMMSMVAATERTLPYWRRMLGEVGFEITKVHKYDPELEYSILEAVPSKV